MARPTRAEKAAITKRRSEAIELRLAGVDVLAIGHKLAADPSINSDGLAYPQGYGIERYRQGRPPLEDHQLVIRVCEDITAALAERRIEEAHQVDQLRIVEAARLDRLFYIVYRLALRGDLPAIDRALRLMERRARLLGLDAPARADIKVSDEIDVEIEQLLAQLGPGPQSPAP